MSLIFLLAFFILLTLSGWVISLLVRLRDLWSWIYAERIAIALFLGAWVSSGLVWALGIDHPHAFFWAIALVVGVSIGALALYQRQWAFSLREVMPPCDAGTPPMRATFAFLALVVVALYLTRLSMVTFPTMQLTPAFSILSQYFSLSWVTSPIWVGLMLIVSSLLLSGAILRETRSRSLALFMLIAVLVAATFQSTLPPQISLLMGSYWAFCAYAFSRALRGECDRVSTGVYFLVLAVLSPWLYFPALLSLPVLVFTIARHGRVGTVRLNTYSFSALIPGALLAAFLLLWWGGISWHFWDAWSFLPGILFAFLHETFHTARARGMFQGKWYL